MTWWRKRDSEMNAEFEHHLESLEAEHRARGLSEEDARFAAQRDFGGMVRTQELYREQRGILWLETLWRDLQYAFRSMRNAPVLTLTVLATLSLGIGANTAIFSVFNTVMLRKLPVAQPEQLVEFLQKYPGEPRDSGYMGWTSYEHFRDHNHVFSALTGMSFDNLSPVRVDGSNPVTVIRENVLGNYFQVLGSSQQSDA